MNHYEKDNHNHSAGPGLDWLPQPSQAHSSPATPRTLPQGYNPMGNTGQAAAGSPDGCRGQKASKREPMTKAGFLRHCSRAAIAMLYSRRPGQAQDVVPIIGTDTENGITTTITGHKEGDVLVIDKASQTRPTPNSYRGRI